MKVSQQLLSMKSFGVLGLMLAFALVGCSAPRGLGHMPSAPVPVKDPAQSEVESAFAREAGELPIASAALFDKTPVGTAQVTAVARYVNGLGEMCTKVELKAQSNKTLAGLCKGKDGVWRYVPLSN